MAPRRGGGGGYRSGSGGSSCDSSAFGSSQAIVLLTFLVIFLVSCLTLCYLYPIRRKRALLRGHEKDGALWTVLWLSLAFETFAVILDMSGLIVGQCSGSHYNTVIWLTVVSVCLGFLSDFLLLATLLIPITRLMYECAGDIVSSAAAISLKVFVGVMGADVIVAIALSIWLITDASSGYTYDQYSGGFYGG
ncbi:hypothetical protein FQN49_008912, partial [Arthroderma sp. PD_2]